MTESEGLSRDKLIEQGTRALHADHCCNGDETGCTYPEEMRMDQAQARIALDATLRAVADDLDAMRYGAGVSVREDNNGDMYGEDLAYLDGIEAAADRVRRLLGAIVQYAPLPIHRTEAGYPNCATCDGGGCPDCTDPA